MQLFFTNLYNFFSTHPNYTLIALQYGSTLNVPGSTSSGTGPNYYDSPSSFGSSAFFVVRANATAARPYDVYHLFQWSGSNGDNVNFSFNASPGNPGLLNGSSASGVGHACAIGIGGTGGSALSTSNGNPWKGTQNGNGADTKSVTNVWGPPPAGGTGVIIFPRSNSGATGAFRVSSALGHYGENCSELASFGNTTLQSCRMGIAADDDSFAIFWDPNNSNNWYMGYSGLYIPRPNVPSPPYPYCCIESSVSLPFSYGDTSTYGDIAGNASQQGGVACPFTGSVASMQLDYLGNTFMYNNANPSDTNFWPDHQMPGLLYNEWQIPMGIYEVAPEQRSGFLGHIDFVRYMFNVPTADVKSDYSRIFLGSSTLVSIKCSVPWDSQNNTVPGTGTTRPGVTFVTSI